MMTSRRTFLVSATAVATALAGCAAAPRRSAPIRTPTAVADRPGPDPAPAPGTGPREPGVGPGSGVHQPGSGPMGPGSGVHRPDSGSMGLGPTGPGFGPSTEPSQSTDPELAEWFADVPNYQGVMDWTGVETVRVRVGVGDGFRFGPAAIRVSPGTRVVWEWTGQGGSHNVVDTDATFESPYFAAAGEKFAHTFTEAGTFRYVCAPHLSLGMKGAVVVADE
ncbi:halocyanin domain-containing protein [Salinigranum sp. GCM10025319]|uniref:halocyanin domain-containing protein n=1 Tax=Salinigranum sp. GCM10025319 TaxID=3252687 RepID=UPI00361BF1E7